MPEWKPGNRTGHGRLPKWQDRAVRARYSGTCVLFPGGAVVKLGGFVGATLAGYVAWYLVVGFGYMTAFIVSTIASGFGMYYGAKIAKKYAP
jgi:hypothetical protein